MIERNVARFGAVEDLVHVVRETLGKFAQIRRIRHQPTEIHVVAVGINDRKTVFSSQFDDQGAMRQKAAALVNDGSIYLLLSQIGEAAADLRFAHIRKEIHYQRDSQMLPCFAKRQSRAVVPRPRLQGGDFDRRRYRLLQDLQALAKDFVPRFIADPGKVAAGMREVRNQFSAIGSPVIPTIGTVAVAAANALTRSL